MEFRLIKFSILSWWYSETHLQIVLFPSSAAPGSCGCSVSFRTFLFLRNAPTLPPGALGIRILCDVVVALTWFVLPPWMKGFSCSSLDIQAPCCSLYGKCSFSSCQHEDPSPGIPCLWSLHQNSFPNIAFSVALLLEAPAMSPVNSHRPIEAAPHLGFVHLADPSSLDDRNKPRVCFEWMKNSNKAKQNLQSSSSSVKGYGAQGYYGVSVL